MGTRALSLATLDELELLIRSHHPLVFLEAAEAERAEEVLRRLAQKAGLPLFHFTAGQGLEREGERGPVYGTDTVERALRHVLAAGLDALYHFAHADDSWREPAVVAALAAVERKLRRTPGAIVVTGLEWSLPQTLAPLVATVRLSPPSPEEYYECVRSVLSEVRERVRVTVELSGAQIGTLLGHLKGLTLSEVRRILAQAMLRDQSLSQLTVERVIEAKQRLVEESGVLEYFPVREELDAVAGLDTLKHWLATRAKAFQDAARATKFGLTPPRGLLLLGVQGCGKSLCAKAVARAWSLPLLRLDPARLYSKYVGETENNLRQAIELAERLAPLVVWVDEIEKAFASSDGDAGASQRLLGTFLTWLQEKKQTVFVVATANDVTKLPPELLRKGRFDEIFFVDLPNLASRVRILEVHLEKRGRNPKAFDLQTLAALADGYSGAEIEQALIAALYAAFAQGIEVSDQHIAQALRETYPLSVTMREPIEALRHWAEGRTVSAD